MILLSVREIHEKMKKYDPNDPKNKSLFESYKIMKDSCRDYYVLVTLMVLNSISIILSLCVFISK